MKNLIKNIAIMLLLTTSTLSMAVNLEFFNSQDAHGNTVLHNIVYEKNVPTDITNRQERERLLTEAAMRQILVTATAIKARANLNIENNNCETPLILAAAHGNEHMVQILVDANANPFTKDNLGKSALEHAQERGYTTIVTKLQTAMHIQPESTVRSFLRFVMGNLF